MSVYFTDLFSNEKKPHTHARTRTHTHTHTHRVSHLDSLTTLCQLVKKKNSQFKTNCISLKKVDLV